jgi:hypothetical protein
MHYFRYPSAAVAAGPSEKGPIPHRSRVASSSSKAPMVLWASTAFPCKDGCRLVGVRRQNATEVEVAWTRPGSAAVEWLPARLMLTEEDARKWLRVARFSRQ